METSYETSFGSGDRKELINIYTTSGLFSKPDLSVLIDGLKAGIGVGNYLLKQTLNGTQTITFEFLEGKIITEATVNFSATVDNGIWQWEGSNDNLTYKKIGNSFTWKKSTNNVLVMNTLESNSTRYIYYRLRGISGDINLSSPTLFEIEFKTDIPVYKVLLKNNNEYIKWNTQTAEFEKIDIQNINEDSFIQHGISPSDLSLILEKDWNKLSGEVSLIHYNNELLSKETHFSIETEPFTFYEEMGDSMDILYYTDNPSVENATLEMNVNYSPLDEIEGDFEVVTWINGDENTDIEDVKRNVSLQALPLGQMIISKEDIILYGSLKEVMLTRLKEMDKAIIKIAMSFDKGETWESFKNGSWIDINLTTVDGIKNDGIDIDKLLDIPQFDFDLKSQNSTIRLAYYIEESVRDNDSATLEQLDFNQEMSLKTPFISDMKFYILNTKSTIDLVFEGKQLTGTVNDVDLGKVKYRILLNGNPYFPANGDFTEPQPSPLNISINISNQAILMGQENSLVVEFEDYWGEADSWSTTFVGTFNGLIFKDPNGDAYATDIGEILKYLDIGTLIAGQNSEEFEIKLENTYGYAVSNPILTSYTETNAKIELSKTNSPFIGQDVIQWEDLVLENGDSLTFYVRIATTLTTTPVMGGVFELRVNADKVEK